MTPSPPLTLLQDFHPQDPLPCCIEVLEPSYVLTPFLLPPTHQNCNFPLWLDAPPPFLMAFSFSLSRRGSFSVFYQRSVTPRSPCPFDPYPLPAACAPSVLSVFPPDRLTPEEPIFLLFFFLEEVCGSSPTAAPFFS